MCSTHHVPVRAYFFHITEKATRTTTTHQSKTPRRWRHALQKRRARVSTSPVRRRRRSSASPAASSWSSARWIAKRHHFRPIFYDRATGDGHIGTSGAVKGRASSRRPTPAACGMRTIAKYRLLALHAHIVPRLIFPGAPEDVDGMEEDPARDVSSKRQ